MTPPPSYYEILNLPHSPNDVSIQTAEQLKTAYRRALLHHHPDKNLRQPMTTSGLVDEKKVTSKENYSIDQITKAYAILSVPKLRSEYDGSLKKRHPCSTDDTLRDRKSFRTGSETVDLDDMCYDEEGEFWYRSCRCGEKAGFLIRESDLDEASDIGELHVGCKGCSLWLRILFGVVESGGDGQPIEH